MLFTCIVRGLGQWLYADFPACKVTVFRSRILIGWSATGSAHRNSPATHMNARINIPTRGPHLGLPNSTNVHSLNWLRRHVGQWCDRLTRSATINGRFIDDGSGIYGPHGSHEGTEMGSAITHRVRPQQ
jgi:hypothetical protein